MIPSVWLPPGPPELLRTLDALLEDGERGQALGGAASVRLLLAVLLPAAVWVAGKTAAAVRFQAVTAIATLFRSPPASSPLPPVH